MDDPLHVVGLGDLPGGLAPAATTIEVPPGLAPGKVQEGRLRTDENLVFRLPVADGSAGGEAPPQAIPVAPLPEFGSPTLAAALAAADYPGILGALAEDMVLVRVRPAAGQCEAVGLASEPLPAGRGGGAALTLPLFSSAATLAAHLGDAPDRCFVVRHGAALVDYVVDRRDRIESVVFDPDGPAPYEIAVAEFVGILNALGAEDESEVGIPPSDDLAPGEVVGFDLRFPSHWAVLDLSADEETQRHRIRRLVKEQTRSLSDQGATLRHDLREWLASSTAKAASAGGREFGFLLAHTNQAAAAVSVVNYWHDLGAGDGRPAFDRLRDQMVGSAGDADDLVSLDVDGDRLIRRTHVRQGDPGPGGQDLSLLVIDYWIATPSAASVAHVSFSTPHLGAREAILALADSLVFGGTWLEAPAS